MHGAYHIITGVFYYSPRKVIPFDPTHFKQFLYAQKKTTRFLDTIAFDCDGTHPESRDVDEALWNLEKSMIIQKELPDYTPLHISSACTTLFEKFIKPQFSDDELSILKDLAVQFNESLKRRPSRPYTL